MGLLRLQQRPDHRSKARPAADQACVDETKPDALAADWAVVVAKRVGHDISATEEAHAEQACAAKPDRIADDKGKQEE